VHVEEMWSYRKTCAYTTLSSHHPLLLWFKGKGTAWTEHRTVPYTKLGVGVAKAKVKTSSLMRAIVWMFMNVYKYKFHKIIRR